MICVRTEASEGKFLTLKLMDYSKRIALAGWMRVTK